MTPQEQAQFKAIGDEAKRTGQNVAESYAKYMRDYQDEKDFAEQQQGTKKELDQIQSEEAKRQSSARIEQSRKSLSGLRQSLAFVGTMGRP
tara:strand:- start:667 stop:939 length:273 start_codon:yes stop_codon:yes gene_type:complete